VPATTSGPLSGKNLPAAAAVGAGFFAHVVPSNGEEGTVSNGSSVQERTPASIVDGLVPLGCPGVDDAGPIPAPEHALQRTYRSADGRSAVALALQYRTEKAAAHLLRTLRQMLAHCTPPAVHARGGPARTVAAVTRANASTMVDTRHDVGIGGDPTRWDETVVRAGARVSLLVVQRAGQLAGPPVELRLRTQRAALAR
jgi:hypothetical protein